MQAQESEKQTISVGMMGGTFTLSFPGRISPFRRLLIKVWLKLFRTVPVWLLPKQRVTNALHYNVPPERLRGELATLLDIPVQHIPVEPSATHPQSMTLRFLGEEEGRDKNDE